MSCFPAARSGGCGYGSIGVTRARFHERIVCHRYGDRDLQVVIASQYGQRYDHDWSELAEIAALKQGRLRPGALVFDLGASYGVIAMMLASAVTPAEPRLHARGGRPLERPARVRTQWDGR